MLLSFGLFLKLTQRNCFFARKDYMKEAKNVTAKNNSYDREGGQGFL